MVLAIMQPYFLPYIGYFQLLNVVDRFVLYDDVNFINRGYINRNNILVNGKASLFSIPLKEASQNKLIREIALADDNSWQKKFCRTVEQSYKKAPQFEQVFPVFLDIMGYTPENVGDFCRYALVKIAQHLSINTEIVPSSTIYHNAELRKEERILDICRIEKATRYINPQGGVELYEKGEFAAKGVELSFLKARLTPYPQFGNTFVPGLSILDVLMFNDVGQVQELLQHYELA
ncbi:WbqC family protein [Ravibacter arvi]|uniref:WbqC family protein n=1 Tax=Ravibacter arvi TaxID=2051041 RepID=A0ABP8MAH5_9BACT